MIKDKSYQWKTVFNGNVNKTVLFTLTSTQGFLFGDIQWYIVQAHFFITHKK